MEHTKITLFPAPTTKNPKPRPAILISANMMPLEKHFVFHGMGTCRALRPATPFFASALKPLPPGGIVWLARHIRRAGIARMTVHISSKTPADVSQDGTLPAETGSLIPINVSGMP